ncbi:YlbF family regulator [Streptococcus pseudoporcinus]|uniref:Regulatory protein ylbF n=1 Tax=Streptococcus pseudoporcinus TaxID=361101 RepID=A0A4U9XZJ3_9STRE|nr:YlbF family regulator [Streptococcus pseudoporcinus]VTS18678.1 Regulatory protein ylbF [Streptococcus pseudoporcinus]VUC68678.1 Regulatory protein ylbF [Streptococcus pseudoporcinus]VUC99385.1 Regulatory protein ylbF [Streptococcus pseudoporcinus]VUC99777.1 Regulatory protein ylbF [Streptococcus pseudoporcinus]
MLVINEDLFAIEDAIDYLIEDIKKTEEFQTYLKVYNEFEQDQQLQYDIEQFQRSLTALSDQKDYLRYRPGSKSLNKEILRQKRELDLHPKVVVLRIAEVDLQTILAEIAESIAETVSSTIFIDTGLPLAERRERITKGIYRNIKEGNSACLKDKIELE